MLSALSQSFKSACRDACGIGAIMQIEYIIGEVLKPDLAPVQTARKTAQPVSPKISLYAPYLTQCATMLVRRRKEGHFLPSERDLIGFVSARSNHLHIKARSVGHGACLQHRLAGMKLQHFI